MIPSQADTSRLALRLATEEAFGSNPSTGTKVITNATNAAPIVVTVAAHGYPTGHVVVVASVGGNTNANGVHEIEVVDANNFKLVGTQGNSAYTSGGTVKAAVVSLPITGEGLKYNLEKKRSQQIRNDGQAAGLTTVAASVDGPMNFELSYKDFDWILAAALRAQWAPYGHRGLGDVFTGTVSATNTITASVAPTGGSAFTTLKKGQWILLSGFSVGANNIPVQISKVTAPTTTVIVVEGTPLTNGANGAACRISSSRLANGTLWRPFSGEKEFGDITQIYPYNGLTIDGLDLSFAQGEIPTGSVSFMGKKSAVPLSVTALDTPQAAANYDVINPVTGIQQILRDGAAPVESFMSLRLSVKNSLRKRMAVGNLGPVGMGYGRCLVSGSLEAYLQDGTRFTKFVNNTPFLMSWAALDASFNGYVITVTRAKFGDANPNPTQADADVTDPGSFEAEFDSSQAAGSGYDKTIFIDRIGVQV